MDDLIKRQEKLIEEAEACLAHVEDDLTIVDEKSQQLVQEEDEESTLRTLQLVLQYRLDTQDSLQRILSCNQSLWQILGVSSQNPSSVNIERLSYALGGDDLHQALSMLSRLVDSLLRILQRYYASKLSLSGSPVQGKSKPSLKPPVVIGPLLYKKMVRIVDTQKSFNFILEELNKILIIKMIEPNRKTVILKHYTQLQVVMTRFYEALLRGLVLSKGLYDRLEKASMLTKKLDELVFQAKQVLSQSPQLLEKPRLFQPTKAISSSQELEARATEKRLGYFFNH